MSEIVQFPATAAKTLVEGYCNDFIELAASLAQTLEQVSMRKLELGESRESLVRVEKGMRDLADAIGALLESTEGTSRPTATREPPLLPDRHPAGPSAPAGSPAPGPKPPAQQHPTHVPSSANRQAALGERQPGRDCIIQGTTDSMPMTSVFQFLSRMRKSGKLIVALDGEQMTLEVVDGCVEVVQSTRPPAGERIGDLLVANGYVRRELVAEIMRGKRLTARQLGTQLVRAGQVTLAQLRKTLRMQAQRRIQRVMQAKAANYEFLEGRRESRPDHMRIRVPLQPPASPSRPSGGRQNG